ncbi:RNA polymerase II-binding domain-containing protein [Neohortaea acidophila]|uniref:RNA polymerase II-binding domain-containing protein n=1 Tax=Neohortaea acidophila TaxID=245834 RepID=A0A6A6PZ97_9PEZI|nr:RNA polymerase II-binding domain-containing protein [Neohortaea acidophila]KAF2485081.1 RNA polymerase II-binding domain-containing protein [Neohortaea acidophila]
MSYSDEAVKAKLSSLSETQDSIVTVAQWIMFHRRHADRTASLWLERLQESNTSKKLNLVYLANEVVQQSRARNKTDFLLAFEPLIGDATSLAYKNASQEVQGKLRRVVEVWRQRNIFDPRIQTQTEQMLDEIDKQRGGGQANGTGSGSGRRLGGSLFGGSGGSVPSELEAAAKLHASLSKAEVNVKPSVDTANKEYAKMTDPDTPVPTAPVHAARLSQLMKSLAAAQGAVEASVQARRALLAELDRLVESHKAKLAVDETTAADIVTRKDDIENKKKEVEDNIMRGLSTPTSPTNPTTDPFDLLRANGSRSASKEIERPEAEGFTPPPPDVEAFTPPALETDPEVTGAGDPAAGFDNNATDAELAEVESQERGHGRGDFWDGRGG